MRTRQRVNWRACARHILHVVLGTTSTVLTVTGRLLILGGRQVQTLRARWHPR